MRFWLSVQMSCLVEVSEVRESQKPHCNQVGLGADMS